MFQLNFALWISSELPEQKEGFFSFVLLIIAVRTKSRMRDKNTQTWYAARDSSLNSLKDRSIYKNDGGIALGRPYTGQLLPGQLSAWAVVARAVVLAPSRYKSKRVNYSLLNPKNEDHLRK